MLRYILIAILTAFFMIGTPPSSSRADVCQEDESCWDCTSMGNRVCGPRVLVCQPTQRDGQLFLDQCDWYATS